MVSAYIYIYTHITTHSIFVDTINFLKIFEHEVVLHKIVQPLDGEKILIKLLLLILVLDELSIEN